MLFIKDMKNLRIYKREFFLPTKEAEKPANKKTHNTTQTIFLLAKSHDLIGTFLGTAFELSANCGLLSSSESKI